MLARRRAQRASRFAAVSTAGILLAAACSPPTTSSTAAAPAARLNDIQHIVVVYMENWSFDSLYGSFPGADGLAGAGRTTQLDKASIPYAQLPQPLDRTKAAKPTSAVPAPPKPADPRFPASIGNGPFNLETYVPPTNTIGDLGDGFYQEQAAIDGGRMDKYVVTGGVGALPMGYYDASPLPLGQLAKQYTLDDHFFHAAFGTSMLNHFWLISGATPSWPSTPASMRAVLGPNGQLVKDGAVTPDGYLVNTAYPSGGPHPTTTPASQLVPPLQTATIGDRLRAKGISWAWYAGGWNNALAIPSPFSSSTINRSRTSPTTPTGPPAKPPTSRMRPIWSAPSAPTRCQPLASTSRSAPTTSIPGTPTCSTANSTPPT